MDRLATWIVARRHRATLVNVVMLSIILALADSAQLHAVVGGLAVAVAGGLFSWRAARDSIGRQRETNALRLALTWIPGILAMLLAVLALYLVNTSASGSLAHVLGVILFTAQIAMLTLACADLSPTVRGAAAPGGSI